MPPFDHVTRLAGTNVVSYGLSQRPADQVLAARYRPHLDGHDLGVSFQTWAELLVGAETAGWDRAQFGELMETYTVIPWTEELVEIYVGLRVRARERNRRFRAPRLGGADAWIAATAFRYELPLVTHDRALGSLPEIEVVTELDD